MSSSLINQNRFNLGFELEILLIPSKISKQKFITLLKTIHNDITVSVDYSIAPDNHREGRAMEIKTPPLPSKKAIELLARLFQLIKLYGYTNHSTGLHLNLSPRKDSDYYSVNPSYLVASPLFKEMVRFFGRERTGYCYAFSEVEEKSTPLNFWSKLCRGDGVVNRYFYDFGPKSVAVNFWNYHPVRRANSRLEIRAMGNRDYHLKLDKVIAFTNKTLKEFLKSIKTKKFYNIK